MTQETFRSIKATYYRTALDLVESYRKDAIFNGLEFNIHAEEKAVELFASTVMEAGISFLDNPMETPFISCWRRVTSAIPDAFEQIDSAVTTDMKEFGPIR